MKRLYFIRHGQSVDNLNGVYSGRFDTPLTGQGREQIRQAAEAMTDLNLGAIVSSPSSRTVESAKIIAEYIKFPVDNIYVSDLFAERSLGKLEEKPYQAGEVQDAVSGIEQTEDLLARAQQAYNWLNRLEIDNVLVVSHGSFGRALRAVVLPDKYSYSTPEYFHNAVLTSLL